MNPDAHDWFHGIDELGVIAIIPTLVAVAGGASAQTSAPPPAGSVAATPDTA